MDDPKSVNPRPSTGSRPDVNRQDEGVVGFLDDLSSLTDLQARLAALELREAARQWAPSLTLILLGSLLLIAGTVVAVMSVADWLALHWRIDLLTSQGIVAVLSLLLGLVLVYSGGARMALGAHPFPFTRKQFRQNLAWVRNSLFGRTRSTP